MGWTVAVLFAFGVIYFSIHFDSENVLASLLRLLYDAVLAALGVSMIRAGRTLRRPGGFRGAQGGSDRGIESFSLREPAYIRIAAPVEEASLDRRLVRR
jgi:hypothetical protein